MSLWDKIKGEFIDIVQWLDDSRDTLVYRFERYDNEIKYGAQLVVRESQVAAFVSEGQLADVFKPGMFTLETKNLPILSTLKGWKYGFSSPFKAEVYFVNTRLFTDRKWGTKNPIILRDPEFGAIRLRAFGTYAIRITDPAVFLRQVVGTDSRFTIDELGDQLRDMLVSRFSQVLADAKVAALDLAGHYDRLSKFLQDRMAADFATFGLEISSLVVENISFPPEVEQALDKRASIGAVGDLNAFTRYETAKAIPAAAANPGGLAGAGVGVGFGAMIGAQMAQSTAAPPPPPIPSTGYHVAIGSSPVGPLDMNELQKRANAGQLTRDTLVWKQGMAAWTKAGEVADLAPLFAAAPPPLPAP